jgi:hypothetical protein
MIRKKEVYHLLGVVFGVSFGNLIFLSFDNGSSLISAGIGSHTRFICLCSLEDIC